VPEGISALAPEAMASETCFRILSAAATLTTGPVVVLTSTISQSLDGGTIRITKFVTLQLRNKFPDERIIDFLMNINTFDGTTTLSGIKRPTICDFSSTVIYICIGTNIRSILPT
jgi:hypothetical protein